MKRTGRAAAAQMRSWSLEGKRGVAGYCLRWVRLAWELPGDEISAIREWQSIPPEHRHRDASKAPVGAPHFWTGKRGALKTYGHVALQALEPGWVWSTDAPTRDQIGRVPIGYFETRWGAIYLGWSSELQNRTLPLKADKTETAKNEPETD